MLNVRCIENVEEPVLEHMMDEIESEVDPSVQQPLALEDGEQSDQGVFTRRRLVSGF
ncbi:uncharacterized protein PHALS_01760 [Plasmopara halstedii]|uniref:Uncharacterized protein n=1 Tax=Plasmopara halstedii TaxID=4781 RepID=A0A0P1AVG1_PLAHL|nr:uncharacterized protein PHALS_01760 [Plasmopara halstedii]CEG45468.1 hypothetical protein PHALS_01760 [Plasmopara halstedii]|eukprot:XP_024581837.1 hypothetical protein PHALS_01760 [Plasmopara halstedii]